MLLIRCPWCGLREESEFSYGGEAHIARPKAPETLSDEAWERYLFMRSNPRGVNCLFVDPASMHPTLGRSRYINSIINSSSVSVSGHLINRCTRLAGSATLCQK